MFYYYYYYYCCQASARQLTNLDHPVTYEISDSRASLPLDLYIVEISIGVCYDVRFPLNRIFFLEKRGGGEKNKFCVCRTHAALLHRYIVPCARLFTQLWKFASI